MVDKLQELELQHAGLQDLIVTLKDGKGTYVQVHRRWRNGTLPCLPAGAQKVAEWHACVCCLQVRKI